MPETGHGDPATGGFGPENLPYGVDERGRVVVAHGDDVIDLELAGDLGVDRRVWTSGSLNAFMSLGPDAWSGVREALRRRLSELPAAAVRRRDAVRLVLPVEIADYVDFYASREHATAMGRLLRPGTEPLPEAWTHLPIAYHGRSATVVVSGEDVPRPSGIRNSDGGPTYGPTRCLDVEVELGFVVGVGNRRGEPIPAERAGDHVFGAVLLNDWSARDVQAFEYRPLGPFLGKSFATSISPWVVPLSALEPWRVPGPLQDPPPARYLRTAEPRGIDVRLELVLNGTVLSSTTTAGLYWSMAQQLAHLTANGAATRTGELFATGTVSGSTPRSAGSLMELSSAGREMLVLEDGQKRTWLEDGDCVAIRGWCGDPGTSDWVSFGEVRGEVRPGPEEVVVR
ncbi:MAG: fahA [Acidimicrobiaceae bacterium]|nr:fahA [Acidimicrobiaceae bacterium]